MKASRAPSLEDRIRQIRAEVEALIDARASAIAKQTPGVPAGVVRNLLTARTPACPCAQYLALNEAGGGTKAIGDGA